MDPQVSVKQPDQNVPVGPSSLRRRCNDYFGLFLLICLNMLNYLDRYAISAVLIKIQDYFDVDDSLAGLLNTVFICSFMVFAPIFGYLGDRYSRKWIINVGVGIWIACVIGSTFVKENQFGIFMFLRAMIGIGEASYATCACTIISDTFIGNARSRALMLFYFAIPVGAGLAYATAGVVADVTGQWQWGVRVSPVAGIVCLLLYQLIKEPKHGQLEGTSTVTSTWKEDLVALATCRSYVWSSFGFTAVTFTSGIAAFWGAAFIEYSQTSFTDQDYDSTEGSLLFGVCTGVGGFIGTVLGSVCSVEIRKYTKVADPLICGVALLICTPFMYCALVVIEYSLTGFWVTVFIAITLLSANWAITPDILLYVTLPRRRATATALQILLSHLLGDAAGPYIIGAISDSQHKGYDMMTNYSHFLSLQRALFAITFMTLLGAFAYLAASWYVVLDRENAAAEMSLDATKDTTVVNGDGLNDILDCIDGSMDGPVSNSSDIKL